MKPKKELGQNFLRDQETIERLVSASNPQKTDNYLEIGPGEGVVTQILAGQINRVVAVELDNDLIPNLKNLTNTINNITIINTDILEFICSDVSIRRYKINKVVGSIPYQITSPLLHSLAKLTMTTSIESATLLTQKEVGQKIIADVPNASYLSNFVQSYFDIKFIGTVSRERFHPIPKVDGAIIQLISNKDKSTQIEVEKWSTFLHKAFEHPRKMLRKVFDEKILREAEILPTQRPQEIVLEIWKRLYKLCESFPSPS